jgi:hypothetical protein
MAGSHQAEIRPATSMTSSVSGLQATQAKHLHCCYRGPIGSMLRSLSMSITIKGGVADLEGRCLTSLQDFMWPTLLNISVLWNDLADRLL